MNVFIARQPIFDKNKKVVAYELLFRGRNSSAYDAADDDQATRDVIANTLLLFGIDFLTGYKRAFINFTENLLKSEVAECIPKDLVTIEVLETVYPGKEIAGVCQSLKKSGYQLALDDFVFRPEHQALLQWVDIIKIDFKQTLGMERRDIVNKVSRPHIAFLAEKVETREDFEDAGRCGYSFFQGYFFSKPETLLRKDIPGHKTHYRHIVGEIMRPNIDYARLESIIGHDVAFSYKLLKFINSSAFGFSGTIKSIRQALVMLGQEELVRWVTLLLLREYGLDKPDELIKLSVIRAKFGELLALKSELKSRSSDVFLLGMFSLIDALTDRPLAEMLAELPLAGDIKDVLLNAGGQSRLCQLYQTIIAYERGDWEPLAGLLAELNIAESAVAEAYLAAIKWADSLV